MTKFAKFLWDVYALPVSLLYNFELDILLGIYQDSLKTEPRKYNESDRVT